MAISERVQLLEERMRLHCDSEPRQLDEEIRRITNLNAAKGKLKSGQTLIEVRRAMEVFIDRRSERYIKYFDEASIADHPELAEPITAQVEALFSTDLPLLQSRLDKLYKLVGHERAAAQVHEELLVHLESTKQNLLLSVRNKLDVAGDVRAESANLAEDVVDLKPNFMGIGMNLNALWRRIRNITWR